jgi:exopolysaccharide biosynthesis polyprenyl glycosylphosphotransferase
MNEPSTLEERPLIEPRWLMPVVDSVLVFLAFGIAYLLRYELQIFRPLYDPNRREFLPYLPYAAFYSLILIFMYQARGLYRNIRGRAWMEEVTTISSGVANATVILLALYFALQPLITSRLMLIYIAVLTVVLQSLSRAIRQIVLAHLRGKGIGVQRVVIIGMGEVGQAILRTLVSRQELGYKVVGYLDDRPERGESDLGRVAGLGKLENLQNVLIAHGIDLVIFTLQWKHYDKIVELARIVRQNNTDMRVVPDIFQLNLRQVQVENLDGIPLLGIGGIPHLQGASRLLKRALDISIVLLLAPAWLIVFALVALTIKLEDGGAILYKAKRVGENGHEFEMWKFRSMIPNAEQMRDQIMEAARQDPRHPKLVNDPRITRVGKFIRRTSIDEMPNIINVLKGEMSLVGPRPPIPDEVAKYENWHLQRLKTIPGITGLWQISGRADVPFDEMCLMDIYYIENWSLKYDLQILLMTIPRVLLRHGAY